MIVKQMEQMDQNPSKNTKAKITKINNAFMHFM